jgi:hypothetical protein
MIFMYIILYVEYNRKKTDLRFSEIRAPVSLATEKAYAFSITILNIFYYKNHQTFK